MTMIRTARVVGMRTDGAQITAVRVNYPYLLRHPDGMQLVWAVCPSGGYEDRGDLPIWNTRAEHLAFRSQNGRWIAYAITRGMPRCHQLIRRCGDTQSGYG
jgi:hypothetical protein